MQKALHMHSRTSRMRKGRHWSDLYISTIFYLLCSPFAPALSSPALCTKYSRTLMDNRTKVMPIVFLITMFCTMVSSVRAHFTFIFMGDEVSVLCDCVIKAAEVGIWWVADSSFTMNLPTQPSLWDKFEPYIVLYQLEIFLKYHFL